MARRYDWREDVEAVAENRAQILTGPKDIERAKLMLFTLALAGRLVSTMVAGPATPSKAKELMGFVEEITHSFRGADGMAAEITAFAEWCGIPIDDVPTETIH